MGAGAGWGGVTEDSIVGLSFSTITPFSFSVPRGWPFSLEALEFQN